MVSKRKQRRRSSLPLIFALGLGALHPLACSRRAEIEDTPNSVLPPSMEIPRPDGGVPAVEDAPLDNADGASCLERPAQVACRGANDFGCDFDGWLQELAAACQAQTDCHTDGWLEVQLGPEGCAAELRMEDPDSAYVACISEQLSQFRCPCPDVSGSLFLGLDHDGCTHVRCGSSEFPCPAGLRCQEGVCVAEEGAAGASGD